MTPRWTVPVDLGGEEARELLRRELSDPVYADARPPWWQRATQWLWDHLQSALGEVAGAAGSALWIIVLAGVVLLVLFVVARRVGWIERRGGRPTPVFNDRALTAADHRSAAEQAAARQEWATAQLEMFRAVVRTMEERGALDDRPGRTADEAARAAAEVFPAQSDALSTAARDFDLVAYGGRDGSADGYERARVLDDVLRATVMSGSRS